MSLLTRLPHAAPAAAAAGLTVALTVPGHLAAPPSTDSGTAMHPARSSTGPAPATATRPTATGVSVAVAAFRTQPVVLTGADFPGWSSGPEVTARAPELPQYFGIFDTQQYEPAALRSSCYHAKPKPDVNGYTDPYHDDHNCFQPSQLPFRTVPGVEGVSPDSLRGYRWDGHRFVQIPFQVDTKWEHYISNDASGFSFYSGTDEELTYTFDEEPFRYTTNAPFTPADPAIVCHALPDNGRAATPDPNRYLINTDELAFMARDAGPRAPADTPLPPGIVSAREVRLDDASAHVQRFVYVMESARDRAGYWSVPMAYTAANSPYVHYTPDSNADTFVYSQSSYGDYGNARYGPVCTPDGQPVIGEGFKRLADGSLALDPATYVQRRTLDTGTVTTPRYRFRFDGRWLMDDLQVSPDDRGLTSGDYGPSIIDRFKGRAFQQSPGGQTPCCGYEDEQNNWGGSSVTMGIKVGPVRVIRVTWGADSGTNVVRTDIFYAYSIDHVYELRVHPIPPLDGIYTQWDMAAGRVTTYYNPYNPKGVPITGINPVLYGDLNAHIGPDGVSESSNDKVGRLMGPVTVGHPDNRTCTSSACIYGSFNLPDATFSGLASELLSWEELTGPAGTLIEKWGVYQLTPGGSQAVVEAVPYYVDDACFDDGTGDDPGPHLALRSPDEPTTWGYNSAGVPVSPAPPGSVVHQRRCWDHNPDGTPYNIPGTATYNPKLPAQQPDPPPDPNFSPQGDIRYFQGDIATHGLHLMFTSDSDNADLTVPVDEIDAVDHQLVLPGRQGNVGAAYSQQFTVPVLASITPFPLPSAAGAPAHPAVPGAPRVDRPGPALPLPTPARPPVVLPGLPPLLGRLVGRT
jgi:hypothetical protein